MRFNEREIFLLNIIEQHSKIYRLEAMNILQEHLYQDKPIKKSNVASLFRKSVSKLSQSGCIRIIPNIFGLEARENIYIITDKGANINKHIQSNNLDVYRVD